jgi:hypothetical protein
LEKYVSRQSHQNEMRGLQVSELSFHPQQEEDQGKDRAQKILPQMPEAYVAQRIEVVFGWRETGA